jgi:hypothetical protein
VQEKQMSPAVVAATLAAGDLAIMLLEVPTGLVCRSVRASPQSDPSVRSFKCSGMLCCWLGQGIAGLNRCQCVLVALGDAFRSAPIHALLYRTCVATATRSRFPAHSSAAPKPFGLTAMVGLVLAGGAIVTALGFPAGWIAENSPDALQVSRCCAMTRAAGRGFGLWQTARRGG